MRSLPACAGYFNMTFSPMIGEKVFLYLQTDVSIDGA